MEKKRFKEQVEIIRESFGYINRFKNETFVIKIDNALITHPSFPILIADLVLLHRMGIHIILVPGTKNRIDEILEIFHVNSSIVNDIRITSPEAIPFIKMASFDICNRVMTLLAENNTNAVIGNWVKARSIGVRQGIDYQFTGTVENIKTDIIKKIMSEGMIPIFPNIGWSATGKPYNISSNELATSIGTELKAAKLFFLTDFGGIPAKGFRLPPDKYVSSDGIITQLTMDDAADLIDQHPKNVPMQVHELLSLGYKACLNDVKRVHIVDCRIEGMLLKEIFSNRGYGTMIYTNQFENIRKMTYGDIPFVMALMEDSVENDALVPRTSDMLREKLCDFVVYEVDGNIHGCGALHRFSGNSAEIAGIVIDSFYANLGTGNKIIAYLLGVAMREKIKKVFVLTTQTSDWFQSLDFKQGAISDLPQERRKTYNRKRNSRILVYHIPKKRRNRLFTCE